MAIQTVTYVKSGLSGLKKAVSAVTKADKVWLTALEGFFEFINPDDSTQDTVNQEIATAVAQILPSTLQKIEPSLNLSVKQAVRVVLDEVSFLQFANKKLEGKVLGADSTPAGLGKVVIEAEAYLVMTDEAFTFLVAVSKGIEASTDIDGIPGINSDFRTKLGTLRQSAEDARNGSDTQGKKQVGLSPQV